MLRKESEAVPEGNGLVPQQEEFGSGQPTWEELQRLLSEKWDRQIDELKRLLKHQLASQEQDARQPRLAMEADGPANTETRERKEGATSAVQTMFGDSCSARRVEPGLKINSTSFGRWPNLPISLAGKTFWSRTALRHPSRVFHPRRYAQQQPLVAYFPPA